MNNNCEIEKELRTLYDSLENKRSILNILRIEKYKHIVEFLNKKYPMLNDKKYSLGMKIYWFVNGYVDFPKCIECGKPNKTHRCYLSGYYTEYCSKKCSCGENMQRKSREKWNELYGVDNPSKSETIKKKRLETVRREYGCDNVFQNESIKIKSKCSKMDKYGDENYTNPEKRAETNIERYGCENPFGNKVIQKQIRETNKTKYGCEIASKSEIVRSKMSESLSKYEVHNSYVNYLMTNPYSKPNFTEEFYLEHRDKTFEFEFRCNKCGNIYTSRVHCGNIRRCPKCYSSVTTSGKEQELFDFLKTVYSGRIVRKDRTLLNSKEIDIYIPEKKLAIEFDGLYWHSELNGVDKNYHLNKTEECEKRGIRLIHIFEDEWDNKQDIVKDNIKKSLNIYDLIIDSKECEIKDITNEELEDFENSNNIISHDKASIGIGLYYNDILISSISFCKSKSKSENKDSVFSIVRLTTRNGYYVKGWIDMIIEYFEVKYNPLKIICSLDYRWYSKYFLTESKFIYSGSSKPMYWYLNNGCSIRYNKSLFRKCVLKKRLNTYDESKTEYENMICNKFTRIYDCGNIIFVRLAR